ncbi:MAG: class I SAM-dependent methyltransferase [Flavobacteriaceae bacterium]|nr:class I SAM-dependent methyltransferase [Flavobacteriaceae bacterium]
MQKDILGKALLDYFHKRYTEDILTETNISEEDVLPLPYFFRDYEEMPQIEQRALDLAKGKVLDVGCGAGSHALYLQEKGLEVIAIDVSKGAIEVCKLRGVNDAKMLRLLNITEKFDTVLLLMNGTGIFQNLEKAPHYLNHLKNLLNPGGQILIDSSDLIYMFDVDDDGGVWVSTEKEYYGELTFKMTYKGEESDLFEWLYLDFDKLKKLANEAGLKCDQIAEGVHYDYLAKLSL